MKSAKDSTWQKLNKFNFENKITWKQEKKVLAKYNVQHRFDSHTAKEMGGFVLAMLAQLVDSGDVTLAQLKRELLCK